MGTDMTADVAIKADSPVRTKKQDLPGRGRMAASAAGGIDRSPGHEASGDKSLVVRIAGEWGSGKPSFIKLILENLNSFRQRDYLIRVRAGGAAQSLSNFDFFKAG